MAATRFAAIVSAIALCGGIVVAGDRIPIVYSTDLFHPHADPDDHYDLACLLAMPEFDVRGIILDLGGTQAKRPGRPAVEQMMHITGRKVPHGFGLSRALRSRDDKALDEPAGFQAGVNLLLAVLRESKEPVTLFTTGSCRDVAAAFNREPEMLKQKVKAVYFNIGRGPNEPQEECNVGYDPAAYLRMFESGLPLYWCPCFGKDGYQTLYDADQAAVVGACTRPVQNYFVYCLTKSTADPIAFLDQRSASAAEGPEGDVVYGPDVPCRRTPGLPAGSGRFRRPFAGGSRRAGPGRQRDRGIPLRADVGNGGRRQRHPAG